MRRPLALVSVAILVMVMSSTAAVAKTTRLPVSGTQQVIEVDDSEARTWMSADIQHVRGLQVTAIQWDDTMGQGTVLATVNNTIDTRTGEGRAWGSFRSDFDGGGFEGTFNGPVHVNASGTPIGTWQVVARGWGDAAGMQVRGTVVENLATGFATYSGTLFVPGDR
jgi:hypothetical protein